MRFGILGALELRAADGTVVKVREPKVRMLLVALLLSEGRPVPTDSLVEVLWGDDLPAHPLAALHTKVSRLRRTLEDAEPRSGRLVETRAPGYALRADPDAVDMGRFAALVARAMTMTDAVARSAVLAEALALWRGPAFAECRDVALVRLPIQRLEELRLTALEAYADARLDAGEQAGDLALLAGELGDLAARHPLRERLRALHLRALARAGRQHEALEVYHDVRRRLADELGVDPGPELAAAYQEILRPKPAPAVPRPRAGVPVPLTGLVGRAGALAEVVSRLRSARLVTLTGPGGVGKTRLALEVVKRLAGTFPDGVCLVELASRSADVAEAALAALGVRDDAKAGPISAPRRLADTLRRRRLLLVLDNCEHVIEPVAELVELLLKNDPELRILTTSRRSLGLAGEVLWQVPPLDEGSAMELFAERAAAAVPGFTLDAGVSGTVAEVCRRLDGLPLALELAATRLRTLDLQELARRLDDRFQLLSTGHRGAPPQQRTLRVMIDWSWAQLTGPERAVLRRLAVHADGCTIEAAEAVCAGAGVDAGQVLEALAGLVDASLVMTAPRYRLLESVAAYGLERLAEAGETAAARHRHLCHYTAFAERAEPYLRGHDQRIWLERLDAEAANLRAALDFAIEAGAAEHALRLVSAQAWYWFLRGRYTEARLSLGKALAIAGEGPAAVRARAVVWHASFASLTGAGVRVPPVPRTDDPAVRALAAWLRGFVQYSPGGDLADSADAMRQALEAFRSLGDRWGIAATLAIQAGQAMLRGDLAEAGGVGGESLTLFRELGDRWGQLQTVQPLASLAEVKGDYERAERLHADGLRMAQELGLWPGVADRLIGLGHIALLTGDHGRSRELHERARRLAGEQGYVHGELHAELGLALAARRQGDFELAERLLRSVQDRYAKLSSASGSALISAELGFTAEQRGHAASALALHRDSLSIARRNGDLRAVALAIEGLAGAVALDGRPGQAAALLGAAEACRDSVGAPLPPAERGDVDRITAKVRAAIGEQTFAAEFARGLTLDPAEI
ncbi:BTAD domain-containing putative transcriptional regulator [Nonomuraea gerenzanensis]|uniref:Signal transduction response regulator / Tetratricopeptide repeat-containing protein n=1 Tax=Nonomuraea gerenzanensis TaxID=93944 RepID=A0A1M4ECU6_9ACTN|nr:BTAD domain-containing putative transcriptional regulator [Nonomuraea gerenzanensis]UBU08463.1 winged helix-turn-helix domain-containing protein [Nonomuraea gerenzanensis]SBO96807.1 Signal transduction response regulator / Tetratricopeptide repeat-containing protein [Nonomuraea gerenzanensis]